MIDLPFVLHTGPLVGSLPASFYLRYLVDMKCWSIWAINV